MAGPAGRAQAARPGGGPGPGRIGAGGGSPLPGAGAGFGGPGSGGRGGLDSDMGRVAFGRGGGLGGPRGGWGDKPAGGGIAGVGAAGGGTGAPTYGAAPIGGPAPTYPKLAAKEGLHGTVLLAVSISDGGIVTDISFVRRCTSDVLDNEALRTARRWKYHSGMVDGKVVGGTIKLRVVFELGKEPVIGQM